MFRQVNLKITSQVCHHVLNFLDITLHLKEGKFMPFRKPNDIPLYVDSRSNHSPSILKQILKTIHRRISSLSSGQQSFNEFMKIALKASNFKFPLQYSNATPTSTPSSRRKRHRNVGSFKLPSQLLLVAS